MSSQRRSQRSVFSRRVHIRRFLRAKNEMNTNGIESTSLKLNPLKLQEFCGRNQNLGKVFHTFITIF